MTIELKNLAVKYQDHQVFEDLNLKIPESSMIAIVGPNGVGKSTLLKALAKLIKPNQGQIVIEEDQVTYVEQRVSFNLDFPITIKELIATALINNSNPVSVSQALDLVQMTDLENKKINQVSGGQLQRALIARAIVHNKPVWLLDEPLNGIDQETQEAILKILKAKTKTGTTIILSSHDLDKIEKYFDYLVTLDDYKKVQLSKVG